MATEAPDEPKTRNRAKTESYDVFKADPESGMFEGMGVNIEVTARGDAERRRLAVALATEDLDEEDKSGEYATVVSGEFVTMTRKRKVEPVDEWEV